MKHCTAAEIIWAKNGTNPNQKLCVKNPIFHLLRIIHISDFHSTGHFLMHCDVYHSQNTDPPPALPVRSLRKVRHPDSNSKDKLNFKLDYYFFS